MSTVLIVDDDVFFTRLIKDLVGRMGHRPVSVTDGVRALELVTSEAPDLLITDMLMRPMDGLELCRRIRERPSSARLPVIMISARAGLELKVKSSEVGVDVLLEKPFEMPELEARIRALLTPAGSSAPKAGRLEGDLASLELTTLVQGLNLQRKTGCLTIEGAENAPEVKIWFERGQVHSVTSESRSAGEGRLLLASLAARSAGAYVFESNLVLPPDPNLRMNFMDVVLLLGGD